MKKTRIKVSILKDEISSNLIKLKLNSIIINYIYIAHNRRREARPKGWQHCHAVW